MATATIEETAPSARAISPCGWASRELYAEWPGWKVDSMDEVAVETALVTTLEIGWHWAERASPPAPSGGHAQRSPEGGRPGQALIADREIEDLETAGRDDLAREPLFWQAGLRAPITRLTRREDVGDR